MKFNGKDFAYDNVPSSMDLVHFTMTIPAKSRTRARLGA